jgi:TusA-related sulfurtransferase
MEENIIPDYRLDMQGEPCPYHALKTLEAMENLEKGEISEIISDCPQSINDIPIDAKIMAIHRSRRVYSHTSILIST